MGFSLFEIANETFHQHFSAFEKILTEATKLVESKGVDEEVLLQWRLAPDMYSFKRQFIVASVIAERGMLRLCGEELAEKGNEANSLAEIRSHLQLVEGKIRLLPAEKVNQNPESNITFTVGQNTRSMMRRTYVLNYLIPNVSFHVAISYAILRQLGSPLGKADFLAADIMFPAH